MTTLIAFGFTALILFVSIFSMQLKKSKKKQSSGLKTYTNNDYNVKVQYPKNREKS
jgi:YbbR domain-containing protein